MMIQPMKARSAASKLRRMRNGTALGLTVRDSGPIVWRRDKVDGERSGPEASESEEGVFVGGGLAVRLDFPDLVCTESRLFR